MGKKSPLEFYDEELSRTIRHIQEGLQEYEWPSDGKTSQAEQLVKVDKLLTCAGIFVQQIESEVRGMPKKSDEKTQWKEIVQFRKDTLSHLAEERAKVKEFQFPALDEDTKTTTSNTVTN